MPRPLAVVRRAAGHRPPAGPVFHVAPRSAVAGAPAIVVRGPVIVGSEAWFATSLPGATPALGLTPEPPGRLRPIASLRRRLAALAAAGLVVAVAAMAAGGTQVVLARFTADAAVAGSFSTGSWSAPGRWYLHNNPTPPTGNTLAQQGLGLDATMPTAGTLYNYDTDCDSRAGRQIRRNTGLVTEAGACRYATWRSAALADARTLNGTATLSVWARKGTTGGTNPTLRAFLRVFDPVTSTYTALGTANRVVTANPNQAWVELDLTWSLAGVTVPAGRRIEIKLVATGGNRNVEIVYDANDLASALTLP